MRIPESGVPTLRKAGRQLLLALGLAGLGPAALQAATVTVTSTADTGSGTLRAAIAAASPGDTIRFDLPTPARIFLATPLSINKNLTIEGLGANVLVLDGGNLGVSGRYPKAGTRVFDISGGAVTLKGLRIARGYVRAAGQSGAAAGGNGAGIRISGSTAVVSIDACTFEANYADDNIADVPLGGAIYNDAATLTVTHSAFYDNHAGMGGAIYNHNGSVTLTNSTLSTNGAGYGGAIFQEATSSLNDVTLVNCTLAGNASTSDSASGGLSFYKGSFSLQNTLVTGSSLNSNNSLADVDTSITSGGSFKSQGHNLVSNQGTLSLTAGTGDTIGASGNVINARINGLDRTLLQGGTTPTHPLQALSPAVDGAVSVGGVTTDQRLRSRSGTPDIGAFEYGAAGQTWTLSGNAGVGGAALIYYDNGPKVAAAAGDGSYSLTVPHHWSGTVVPVLAGYTFSPRYLRYDNVTADAPLQDFTASGAGSTVRETLSVSAGGSTPAGVAMGDFDGDGRPDLAVAVGSANSVAVLLNAGGYTFQSAVPHAVGANPYGVTVGDFNKDGNLDLAVTNANGNSVSVLLGNGDGSFQAAVTYALSSSPRSLVVADFNRDGKLDLAVANRGANAVSILLGNGDGTFGAAADTAAGTGTRGLAVGDFNRDGKLDLVTANETAGTASVLLGSGDGTFAAAVAYTAGSGAAAVTAADLNGDGKLDLAVANRTAGTVSVLLGTGTGTFGSAASSTVGTSPSAVSALDFNGDGKADLVTADAGGSGLSLLPGNGDGTFLSRVSLSAGSGPAALAVGDANGDGRPDLVAANAGDGTLSILLNGRTSCGSLAYAAETDYTVGTHPLGLVAVDLDGDGRPDLVAVNGGSNTVSVRPGQGGAAFGTAVAFSVGSSPNSVATADFNQDGKPDLVVTNSAANTVSVLRNTTTTPGTITFAAAQTFSVGSNPYGAAVLDVNGDGKPDLVVANAGTNSVSVLLNTASAGASSFSFATQQTFATNSGPNALAVADVNRDGLPDLLTGNSGGMVSVLLNTTATGSGSASFASAQTVETAGAVYGLAVADFNGDGAPDLAVSNADYDTVTVMLNATTQGGSTVSFVSVTDFSVGTDPRALATADLDGDGRPDLVVSNSGSNNATVLLNTTLQGSSTLAFGSTLTLGLNGAPTGLVARDLGPDGRADLAFCDFTGNRVAVLACAPPTVTVSGNLGTYGAGGAVTYLADGVTRTATADGNADYSFTVPCAWAGKATPSLAGRIFTPAVREHVFLTSNTTADYASELVRFTISGNAGVAGALIGWYDFGTQTATADGSGAYSFTVPYGWTGTVSAAKTGYTFSASHSYSYVTADAASQDFTATPITYTVSGSLGASGAGATLRWTDGTAKSTTADGSGNYSFTVSYNWSGTLKPSLAGYLFAPAKLDFTHVLADSTGNTFTPVACTIAADASVLAGTLNHVASLPSQAGASYTWAVTNGTLTSGQGTSSITYTAGTSGSVALACTVVDAVGSTLSPSLSVPIFTYTAPITTSNPVTAGATGIPASVPALDGAAYTWSATNGTITSGQGTSAVTWTAGSTGTATLVCQVVAGGVTTYGNRAVTVVASPATITAASPVQAEGQGYTASVPSQAGATYLWTLSNGTITAGQGTSSITYTAGSAGPVDLGCTVTLGGTPYVGAKTVTAVPYAATITASTPVFAGQTGLKAFVPVRDGATYTWSVSNGTITDGQGTNTVTYTAGSAGTLTLGCDVVTSGTVSGSKTVTVLADPTAITAETSVIAMTANHRASVPSQSGATYTWTLTNGTITSGQGTYAVTYTAGAAGTLSLGVTVTSSDGSSLSGSRSVTVSTYTAPIVAASPVVTGTTGLTATVFPVDGGTYAWSISNGTITAGQGTYAVTYTAGSTGTATLLCQVGVGGLTTYGSRTVNVVDAPATITASSPVQAGGQGYVASVPNQAGATYSWSITNGTITSGQNGYAVTYTAGSAGSVDLGCTVTLGGTPYTGTKSVTAVPYAATISGSGLVFAGQTGLKASVPALSGATYTWSVSNGTITGGQGTASLTYTAGSAGTLSLSCDVTTSGTVTGSRSVTVLSDATAITAEASVIAMTTGHKASVAPQAGATYAWSVTNGTITAGQGTYSITYTAGSVGNLTLNCTLTDSAGNSIYPTRSVAVSTYTAPITAASPVVTGTTGLAASVLPVDGATYLWSVTNGTITLGQGTAAVTYTAGSTGTATLLCQVTTGGLTTYGNRSVTVVDDPAAITASGPVQAGGQGYVASVPNQAGATYLWSITNGTITSGQGGYAVTYTAGAAGTVDLGCTVTLGGTPYTGTKSVSAVPYAATITGSNLVFAGQTGLKASVPVLSGATYTWSVSNGTITGGQGTASLTYTAGSAGTLTLSCDVASSGTVTGSKAVTVMAGASSITAETSVVATTTGHKASVPPQTGATYLWTVTNGTITAGQGTYAVTYTSGSAGTLTVGCTVTDGAGNSQAGSRTVNVTTYTAPVATATPVVAGTPGHTASVPPVDGATYLWSVTNGTLTSGQGTAAITYTAGSVGSASVQCRVTVGGQPVYGVHSVSVVTSPASIVVVSSVQAGGLGYVATVPAQSGATYLWTATNGTITAGQGTATITFTAGDPGTLDLGCTVTVGGVPTPGIKSVTVLPYAAPVTVASLAFAGQTGVTASVPGLTGASYAWSVTNGTITAGQGTRQVTFTAGSAGTATVSCDVTTTGTVTGSRSVTVLAAAATISAESSVAASSANHRASVSSQAGATYTWTVTNGTITSGQGTATVTYTAGTAGTLTLGCTVTDAAGNALTGTQSVTVN